MARRYERHHKRETLSLETALDNAQTAKRHYARAIKIDPKLSRAHRELGIAAMNEDDIDGAIRCLSEAVALAPDDVLAHHNLAVALATAGQLREARTEYEAAIALGDEPVTLHQYAQLLCRMGDEEGAERHRKSVVDRFGDSIDGHERMVQLLLRVGLVDGALYHLKKLIELEPTSASRHRSYAELCAATGRALEAERHFQEALSINDGCCQGHGLYAYYLVRQEEKEKAALHFQRAWDLRGQPNGSRLDNLVLLLQVASAIGRLEVMVTALAEALPLARAEDKQTYDDLKARAADVEEFLEREATSHADDPGHSTVALCLAGVLRHALGDLMGARDRFRAATAAPYEDRPREAILNWCSLLAHAVGEPGLVVSDEEIDDAIAAAEQAMDLCDVEDDKQGLKETLGRLHGLRARDEKRK
jgi:tetratricopeptide (TPR) repeat protein